MSAIEAVTAAAAVSATGRLEVAWRSSESSIRRSALAAVVTSCVLAASSPMPMVVRVATALVGALLAAAALVDVHERRLPNRLLALAFAAAVAGPVLALDATMLVASLAGGLIAGGSLLLVRLTRGVGVGDVKAATVVGTSVAAGAVIAAPAAVAVTAFVASAYGLLAHRRRIPLGPSLWFGWVVAVLGTSSGWWS